MKVILSLLVTLFSLNAHALSCWTYDCVGKKFVNTAQFMDRKGDVVWELLQTCNTSNESWNQVLEVHPDGFVAEYVNDSGVKVSVTVTSCYNSCQKYTCQ